eukprot:CAMPEP_0114327146 /NCGR_PEP_ID=MMETSP0059-20121206/30139_1 /TAXON_ID=36894 /ORGANISM="Pyramimonas parkeae, Strain CCMP726" /LENGTH=212 /DNA_ID=CAMNT_0001456241 /DNA_START=57 /DNA_END=692 /DNA_ORIENTATION=+
MVIFVERPVVAVVDCFASAHAAALPSCSACQASHVTNPWGCRVPHAEKRWPKFDVVGCKEACPASYCHRFCRERALVHGHARWCGKEALFQQLVRYCEFELPEAWDPVRHVVLLSLHVVARVLEESAGQGAARPVRDLFRQMSGTRNTEPWTPHELHRLIVEMLDMTPEEQLGFAPEDLRECVGKLLCNAIEVRPQSAFAQYMHNSRADRRG